ncbi:MAG: 1-acyl-sn-glycerol-3-phosphate acyltransferase [Bacteroidota bacterium]
MKITLRWYFGSVKIEGLDSVPRDKPLLVTPNHQNAFLDALLTGAYIPIPLHILTRADIFNRWTKPLLSLLNMMPIYRIRDGYAKLSQNDAVFETCKALFRSDKSVLIFAEGNHGEHHYLRPLTKGAARISIFSQQAMQEDLYVLPVGVNYFQHQSSRSGVVLVFGAPVSVREYEKRYEEEGAKGLLAMRDAISDGMKKTLVIPEKIEDYEVLKETIFQEKHIGLSLDELRKIPENTKVEAKRVKGKIAKVLNPLPFLTIRRVLSGVQDKVFISSAKFATALVAFPVWWLIVFFSVGFAFGFKIALLTVFVMIFGLFYSYS